MGFLGPEQRRLKAIYQGKVRDVCGLKNNGEVIFSTSIIKTFCSVLLPEQINKGYKCYGQSNIF